jgi:hypothetical protein
MSVETSLLSILAFLALGLMVAVTGGVAYLTSIEWRDRRRMEREERELRQQRGQRDPKEKKQRGQRKR